MQGTNDISPGSNKSPRTGRPVLKNLQIPPTSNNSAKHKLSNAVPKNSTTTSSSSMSSTSSSSSFSSSSVPFTAATIPTSSSSSSTTKKKKLLSPTTTIHQALSHAATSMSNLANEISHKPYLAVIAGDFSSRVAKDVLQSYQPISSESKSDASKNGNVNSWKTVLTFLSVSDGASLAITCEDLDAIFQSPSLWKDLVQAHFKCDLSTATTVVPKYIFKHRPETFLKPLYKILHADVLSEQQYQQQEYHQPEYHQQEYHQQEYHQQNEHPLDRAYRYLGDCIIFGKVRADSYFRRIVNISNHSPFLPQTLNGVMVAHYAEWLSYQKNGCEEVANLCYARAVHLCQNESPPLTLSLPLVLGARALHALNTNDFFNTNSITSSSSSLTKILSTATTNNNEQAKKTLLRAAEIDILRATSLLQEIEQSQKQIARKRQRTENNSHNSHNNNNNNNNNNSNMTMTIKTEQTKCLLINLLLRIGRNDDAAALITTAPKVQTTSHHKNCATHLSMYLNRALLSCINLDYNQSLQILSNASNDLAWNDPSCQSLVLQCLFCSLVIGTKQSNYDLKSNVAFPNSVADSVARSRGLEAVKDSIFGLVERMEPVSQSSPPSWSSSTTNSSKSSKSFQSFKSSGSRSSTSSTTTLSKPTIVGKRLGTHQQWRCAMIMRLVFQTNQTNQTDQTNQKITKFQRRFELLSEVLIGNKEMKEMNELDGWSMWSLALGNQVEGESDDTYSSSEDGDATMHNNDSSSSNHETSSSSSSSSSSFCSVLSLLPSNSYSCKFYQHIPKV